MAVRDAPPPERRWRRVLLLQLALLPIALAAGELLCRGWLALDGRPWSAERARAEIRRTAAAVADDRPDPGGAGAADEAHARTVLHPYAGFGPRLLLDTQGLEEERRRSGRVPPDELRVLILGGSVAGGFGNPKSAGVGEVAAALETRFPGRPIHFMRHGYGSYKQPQQLALAGYFLSLGLTPHVVVNLDGFNEVALALRNADAGTHPAYPARSKWAHLAASWGDDPERLAELVLAAGGARRRVQDTASRALEWGAPRSAVLGTLALARLRRLRGAYDAAASAYVEALAGAGGSLPATGPPFPVPPLAPDVVAPRDLGPALELAARVWEESSRSLHAMCAARDIVYLHVLQPTLHDEGSKPLTSEEVAHGRAHRTWIEGARRGYPLLRAGGARLAAEGVRFLDASRIFADVEEPLYYDACHFGQAGYARLGRSVGAALVEALEERDGARSAGG